MKLSKEEIGFILYNNRSVNGVVKNFLPNDIDPYKLIDIENKFEWCKSLFQEHEKMVEINLSLIDIDSEDIQIYPNNLYSLSKKIKNSIGKFNDKESKFLMDRKIPNNVIKKWKIFGLSNITNKEDQIIIGATVHPILNKILIDGIDEGGICIPLFNSDGELENCSIRRISDVGKLKYTLAVPDIPIWGLKKKSNEIWITEGIFDMISLNNVGLESCTPSSAVWSGIQLYKLLSTNPHKINVFVDNDMVGLKNGAILKKFFSLMKIPCSTFHSLSAKDACEHFFEKSLGLSEIKEINITDDMIKSNTDESFNFLKHLQKRKF